MSTMTMDKAYNILMNVSHNRSHADAGVLAFIQGKLRNRAEPSGYAATDKARDLLNEMMNDAQKNREEESITCSAYHATTTVRLTSISQDITYVNSEASAAEAEKSRCEEIIMIVKIKIETAYRELAEHNQVCNTTITSLMHQISILRADIVVMERIVHMVCQDTTTYAKASNLQLGEGILKLAEGSTIAEDGAIVKCNTCRVGAEHSAWIQGGIGSLLTGLKSDESKSYVQDHLMEEFAHSSPAKAKPIVLSQEESRETPLFDNPEVVIQP